MEVHTSGYKKSPQPDQEGNEHANQQFNTIGKLFVFWGFFNERVKKSDKTFNIPFENTSKKWIIDKASLNNKFQYNITIIRAILL